MARNTRSSNPDKQDLPLPTKKRKRSEKDEQPQSPPAKHPKTAAAQDSIQETAAELPIDAETALKILNVLEMFVLARFYSIY